MNTEVINDRPNGSGDPALDAELAALTATTTVPMEAWLKTSAEKRRLEQELARLGGGDVAVLKARLDLAEKTIFRQQQQLTQLNKAVMKKNRKIDRLRIEVDGYRAWAGRAPIGVSRPLLNVLRSRSEGLLREAARQRTNGEFTRSTDNA